MAKESPETASALVEELQKDNEALNLRIADLENQLDSANETYNKELDKKKREIDEFIEIINKKNADLDSALNRYEDLKKIKIKEIEKRDEIIAEYKDNHEELKREVVGKFKEIAVPALINKERVVKACLSVEKKPSCKHVAAFIGAVRRFIDPDSDR